MPFRRKLAVPLLGLFVSLTGCPSPDSPKRDRIEMSVPWEIDTLDPHARNWLGSFALSCHFYEPLVTTDADMAIRPALAQRWNNPDPLTWVFHLQPGVRFHSGKALTSADVVFSFRRLRDVPGLDMLTYASGVAEVRALDPLTVEVTTRRPNALLLGALRFVLVVPEGATAGSMAASANGTGPWRLAAFQPGARVTLTRNEAYWGKRPALRSVTVRLQRPADVAIEDLVSGRSQLVQSNLRRLEGTVKGNPRFEMKRQTSLFVKFLSLDITREKSRYVSLPSNPFRKPEVRRAVSLAVDRPALVAGLSTFAVPASQMIPPFVFGYDSTVRLERSDVALARKLLAQAGLPNGFEVTFHTRRLFAEPAERLREMLGAAGIRARLELLSDEEFRVVAMRGDATMSLTRFGCPTGDADLVLRQVLHTRNPARGLGASNEGGFSDPALDRQIEASGEILDMESRRKAVQEILAHAALEGALIPLFLDEDVYAIDRAFTWKPRKDSYILAAEIAPRL